MRILVTGAGGLVGSAVASSAVSTHEVFSTFNQHLPTYGTPMRLDLLDSGEIDRVIARVRPDAIVHAAALTDVDMCERDNSLAEKVNHEATKVISLAAKRVGALLVYVSTDYVFDGAKGRYEEDDHPNPANYYGLTKLKGETAVKASGGDFCIARASVIYGGRPAAGKVNFALWLIESLQKGQSVRVLEDQFVSPTLDSSLAEMIIEVIERGLTGVFHLSGASRVSRYDFAKAVAFAFGLDNALIKPVTADSMNWTAKRPADSSLDVSKAASVLHQKPIEIGEAMVRLRLAMNGASVRS